MGTDYTCGCRCSGGHWFPCKNHLSDLQLLVNEQIKIKVNKRIAWDKNKKEYTDVYYGSFEKIPKEELKNYEEE